ncbi:hypothetical protein [Anaeromicropila populeti]|uniref:Uncharacterized protein n=1 Tax=Anaeromicropila populeti TaxID=37658 RepID=A0A1I6J9N3_9FIRM|nr:hypothetical protein [Anaeromicropila populeti]SFR75628.1 hypothetical protein SAMN05661086_01483 [Anaeromicropila populeti]
MISCDVTAKISALSVALAEGRSVTEIRLMASYCTAISSNLTAICNQILLCEELKKNQTVSEEEEETEDVEEEDLQEVEDEIDELDVEPRIK